MSQAKYFGVLPNAVKNHWRKLVVLKFALGKQLCLIIKFKYIEIQQNY